MMKIIGIFLFLFPFLGLSQTVTISVGELPEDHDYSLPLFLAGNINGWNPSDSNYQLSMNDDSTYSLVLSVNKEVAFKFTCGSWDMVEKQLDCSDISNRIIEKGSTTYSAKIDRWAFTCEEDVPVSTASNNVTLLKQDVYMPQFDRYRTIRMYLPESYETRKKAYPVVYMNDGQNLFDNLTSYSGEWKVDETLDSIAALGGTEAIVVGIDNGERFRIDEYTPWSHPEYGGGQGALYARFVVETLKPYIDSVYRTIPDRSHTSIAGSSLGGLISWYIGLEYPDVFSKVGVFSPSFWFSDSCYTYASEKVINYGSKFYFVAGGNEGGAMDVIEDCQRMMDTLTTIGFTPEELHLSSDPNGRHHESFWRNEFPQFYQWMWKE